MAVAVAVWSAAIAPGEPEQIIPQSDLRITNIALGDELADGAGRTSIKLIYRTPIAPEESEDDEDEEDEENSVELSTTVLCSLTPGKIEQATVDVVLDQDEEYLIQVVGKNTVYLTGNYIDQTPPDQIPYNDESEDESDEEGYDLREVSSDVEVDADEMDIPSDDEGRFEELPDDIGPPKAEASKKRPRESDAVESADGEQKLSKSQKKKLKKLKGANGEAVPTGEEQATPAKANGDAAGKKTDAKEQKGAKDKKDKGEKGGDKKPAEKELSGGVKIKDHKVGTGAQAKKGDMVSVRYIGKLQNGKIFDQNTKGAPFKFRLGKDEVIKGWDVGVAGMQIGSERSIVIPPAMAYGKKKVEGIPANSTLNFEVKLVKIN